MTEPKQIAVEEPAVEGPPVGAQLNKRNTIISSVVTLIVLVIVFWKIIPMFGDYGAAIASIKAMSFAWVMALVGAVLLTIFVYVFPLTAAVPGLKYGQGFVVRQTSYTISNAVPAGGAVGLALQYAMLYSYGIPGGVATAGIAVTSVWSLFMTLGLPIFGVFAALTTGKVSSSYVVAGVVGVVAIATAVIVFALILRSEASARKVGEILGKLAHPITKRLKRTVDVTASIMHFREGIVDVVKERWKWITVSNILVVLTQFLILFVAIRAVGGTKSSGFSIFAAFAAFAISRLASMIPATPGGLGTVDAALIGLLVTFGLDQNTALAADLVWRMASFIPQVCLGIATGVWWRIHEARKAYAESAKLLS